VSNIVADSNKAQVQEVINANGIPLLVTILKDDEFEIQTQAAWAITNIISTANDQQIHYLTEQNVIPPLCALLQCMDSKTIMVAMKGIEVILRLGQTDGELRGDNRNQYANQMEQRGELRKLSALQEHEHSDICQKARHILATYFENHGLRRLS
jgi:importin subunit alpha-1